MMSEQLAFLPEVPLTPGMRVLCRDAEWLVTRVEAADSVHQHQAVHCVGADDLVRGHKSIFLTQLDTVEPVDPRNTELVPDPSPGYRESKLFLEAQLRQMPATGITPDLEGMGAFKHMEFQRRSVELALKQLRPRLLLADDVGLGKTVQVGMILMELMRRGRANRILVLARKSMLTQFQADLWNRFAIPLVRLDTAGIGRLRLRIPANKNPFEVYHRVIISIDTLKNVGRYEHFLENTRWDAVIIDEAHNVAGASVPERHRAHRLARLLSRRTDCMLLTTATPHNGKRETFGRLLSLVDPSAIPDPKFKEYSKEDIEGFFLMRFKEEVRGDVGDELSDRQLVPLTQTTAPASPPEERVFDVLARMREQAPQTTILGKGRRRNHALLQYGLYKLFLSSPEACRKTVEGRLDKVRDQDAESPELDHLQRLAQSLKPLDLSGSTRYRLLRDQLEQIGWNGKPKSPRVLVFTEYRRTQAALAEALAKDFKIHYSDKFEAQAGQVLATINGSCPDVPMMKAIEAFGTGSAPMRMLLATDVASEGLNLHHECHNIIHYDLPWSIITLVQRNGRVDRIGQRHDPVLRYLMVDSSQNVFCGDRDIFGRLVEKVEEINRSTSRGASVLKLYDHEAEERYLAEAGLLAGNRDVLDKPATTAANEATALEAMIDDASLGDQQDFLKFLLGDTEEPASEVPADSGQGKPAGASLYTDREFLLEGYRHLSEGNDEYVPVEEAGKIMIITAPADLRRRLGAPDMAGDVIFGTTAIPEESWPEQGQFRLTEDQDQVDLAIKAARNQSGYWSKELLCTAQHPILQWITERLMMVMRRGEAHLVQSRDLETGELCFLFLGQVASRAGSPLVVDAHAISFTRGGGFRQRSLGEALEAARFHQLVNTGREPNVQAAQLLIPAAVDSSLEHMRSLKKAHERDIIPQLRREERRLRNWSSRRRELLEQEISRLGRKHKRAKQMQKQLQEMDAYLKDRRENWLDTHLRAAPEPSTRLVLVMEGTD